MNVWVPENKERFLASLGAISLSRRTLFNGVSLFLGRNCLQ